MLSHGSAGNFTASLTGMDWGNRTPDGGSSGTCGLSPSAHCFGHALRYCTNANSEQEEKSAKDARALCD